MKTDDLREYEQNMANKEEKLIAAGEEMANVLMLRKTKDTPARYHTTWGTKTALGLALTVDRILNHNTKE